MDRAGRVLEFRIVESSGYKLLDEEVVAMIERASPLPTPPAAMAGERFNYTVPVWFNQR
jgi:protein TonB